MIFRPRLLLKAIFAAAVFCLFSGSSAEAQEPNWYPFAIARAEHRPAIQAMPIYQRPYRPLHFYGNAVRRDYYRGTAMVLPRDLFQVTRAVLQPRRP